MTINQTQAHELNNQDQITSTACGAEQLQKQGVKSKKTKKVSMDIYKVVTDQIIELLETEGADWVKSWSVAGGLPVNVASNNRYNGINVLLLGYAAAKKGFDSNVWGTFKQWTDKGGSLKGQKGTMAVFYKDLFIKDEDTEETKKVPMLKRFTLFNASQVDGIEFEKPETFDNDILESGQAVIDVSGADIVHGGGAAFYASKDDQITMPELCRFHTSTDYYLTAFHELTHWTGHKTRLDRQLANRFGSNAYAAEELIAEMGAAFLAAHSGLSVVPRADHAQYLNSWLKVLKGDKKAIFTAASRAQAAADFILLEDKNLN